MSGRREAIEALASNPQLMLLVVPDGPTKVWVTIDKVTLTQSEIDFFRDCSCFDCAEHENVRECECCGKLVVDFEDVCPNCKLFPFPSELEDVA